MSESAYVVGPLAIVRMRDGKQHYCYTGAPVPDDAADGEVDRLVAKGLVKRGDPAKADPADLDTGAGGLDTSAEPRGAVDRDLADIAAAGGDDRTPPDTAKSTSSRSTSTTSTTSTSSSAAGGTGGKAGGGSGKVSDKT